MNIQVDNEDEDSSKTPEYFLPAGLTDDETGSDSEACVAPESREQQPYSRFDKQNPKDTNKNNGAFYNVRSEPSPEELSPGGSYSSSTGRTVVNTPVTGGLFHRTLSSYQSEALSPPLFSLEEEWKHGFSSNPSASSFSACGLNYPQTTEAFTTTSPSVAAGSTQSSVGLQSQSPTQSFYGPNSRTEPQFSSVPVQQPYFNSIISSSYSPPVTRQPSEAVIGSAFLIPDDSSTSSFTSYVDASVFPFPGERELSSSQHSSSWNRRSTGMKKMCRYFPNCPHGDSCKFYHPSGVSPTYAMTSEVNLSHPGRPRTGSWAGLWSSNAAMEWMHAVIQRHNFFSFAHRHKNSSNAVVTNDSIVCGDRMEDTSKEHRSTIGSIFHPGFIVGNRHRNATKNEATSKNAEKQMKKNAKKSKKDKASTSSLGRESSSTSQPTSLNTNQSLSSSGKQTSFSGNGFSENSNTRSTSSAALSGTTEDGSEQPRKLTRAEKRRLRAIRFYENKRRVAEEAKQKQRLMEEQTTAESKTDEKIYHAQEDKTRETVSSHELTEKVCSKKETFTQNVIGANVVQNQELDSNSVFNNIEEEETDIFYDAPSGDMALLQVSLGNKENTEDNEEKESFEQQLPKPDIASYTDGTMVSIGENNGKCQNNVFVSDSTESDEGKWREPFSSLEFAKSSHSIPCKEQLVYWDTVFVGGDLHSSFASNSFVQNLLVSSCRFESGSTLLCFFVLYMFPIFSALLTYLLPRPLSVNSLWFLLLMAHFWSWQHADNRWKRISTNLYGKNSFGIFAMCRS
ncbi:uncharacterized protein Gasu_23770 [Galdieria sulphuraria]|uniref:C3H1-type domain-containing protein n=1 Tax=Galdieria sulphuraria TaxID=130081 RepID=M2XJD1_GALSU|nr:uncharacterized protein Gasu_23770 [Galdieria sulphuraria]EME30222.1 hypothetical protein Gasu_23770 [Galdieria sulphuraria]|eukprot:XP_005706742.1 hypothetical protein Gasu_23770 [Galdieria sulphuraria]